MTLRARDDAGRRGIYVKIKSSNQNAGSQERRKLASAAHMILANEKRVYSQYHGQPITAIRCEVPMPVLQKIEMIVLVVVTQVTRLMKSEKTIEWSTPIMR
ncbi:hypothetical protein S58_34980 [Bradyrhizobium oligotrophicum S58]|uniref:Uncharacterized protein n=1 Tax=Bradyrhizobium oligotrophicum S58 TaxID=1245469 RepID=M4Z8H8_9BRAD|nr:MULTISPECIES: hypothetical protein [Bradyrhizobium]BAM89491.1 hypothetical protein S58_34980 [Bradyrhizobium oligotrophicum S58]